MPGIREWLFGGRRQTVTLGRAGVLLGPDVVLSGDELEQHMHIIGLTKQGKSKFIASYCAQLLQQGISFALIDPHTDLAEDVLKILIDTGFYTDERAYERVWYIDFARRDRFLRFNYLLQPHFADHDVARHIVEVCKRVWPALADGAAPLFEQVLLHGSFVLIQNRRALTDLPRLLTNKEFREGLLTSVRDSQSVAFWHDQFDRWGRDTQQMIGSALRRVDLLTFAPTLRWSLGQRQNLLDFRALLDKRVSLIVNLGGLDEETQRFLGALLTVGFEVAALSRADIPEHERSTHFLVLDEFSMFSAQSEESLTRVLSLTRKYGLYLVMAHQTWSQANERLRGAVQNAGISVAFKLGRSDAEQTAPMLGRVDPLAIKHEVESPWQLSRTHPQFYSLAEQWEGWVQAIQDLRRQECFVKVGDRTAKIRTVNVATRASREDVRRVQERYAERLLVPAERVVADVEGQFHENPAATVAGVVRDDE